jgi:carboxylesterase type B
MHVAEGKLWKLSHPELAGLCHELAHLSSPQVDADLRDEARRVSGAWAETFAINTHEEGGAARQAGMASALRKRTIELILKSHQAEPG